MKITKTVEIDIYIDGIIEQYDLDKNSTLDEIAEAVHDYVLGLDDADYYLINELDEENIANAVLHEIVEEDE